MVIEARHTALSLKLEDECIRVVNAEQVKTHRRAEDRESALEDPPALITSDKLHPDGPVSVGGVVAPPGVE